MESDAGSRLGFVRIRERVAYLKADRKGPEEREIDYIMKRKDNCRGDGRQASGIKGAGGGIRRGQLHANSSEWNRWEGSGGRVASSPEWMVSTLWWKKRPSLELTVRISIYK